MLEKPDILDEKLIICLQKTYGINITQLSFLPLGADLNAAVYRALAQDGRVYFLKLRRGAFDEVSVTLPKFLSDQGIAQIIPPLETKTGQLYTNLDDFKIILYPFVEGKDAYTVNMQTHHWRELGAALRQLHKASIPPALLKDIPKEDFSQQWRNSVKNFMERLNESYSDPVAIKLAAYLKPKASEILDLVKKTEQLATVIPSVVEGSPLIVCHSDLHAGNFLITKDGVLYIVDWDNPILAPKERDLMFIGGGLGGAGHSPQEEEKFFYEGYGQTSVDPGALAYYRYERIIRDIAEYCEQIFLTNGAAADREQSLFYLQSIFLPGSVLEIASKSDKNLGGTTIP